MTITRRRSYSHLVLVLVGLFGLGACADTGGEADVVEDDTMEGPTSAADTVVAVMGSAEGALLNPNDAGEADLLALPGLDSATVALIVERRPFETMLALDSVVSSRMDSVAADSLYRTLFIPLDVNTASREEILLIPGVGPRMAAEFLEYRPYEGGMAEFRQEIGKYVDEAEVARLERYVVVR